MSIKLIIIDESHHGVMNSPAAPLIGAYRVDIPVITDKVANLTGIFPPLTFIEANYEIRSFALHLVRLFLCMSFLHAPPKPS
jgi:hypothetical protein